MTQFLYGIIVAAASGCGLFFLRFFHETRDRLFLLFALAFLLFGVNWLLLAVLQPPDETRHLFYLPRLGGFLLIIAAVIDKNRRS